MATFKKFEEIEAWQKARELTKRIYKISRATSFARDFGLKAQIRRASVSINIAEGYDRSGTGEFIRSLPPRKDLLRRSNVSFTSPSIKATSTNVRSLS